VKIALFLHGTAIMHSSGLGHTREERVEQVRQRDPSVKDYAGYIPIENAVAKVRDWERRGAEIVYLSSHRRPENVAKDAAVLEHFDFPAGPVLFRQSGEGYAELVLRVMPDVLIEDDCESIGGEAEMIYPHLSGEGQARIGGIVVREFGGIDDLPDDLRALRRSTTRS